MDEILINTGLFHQLLMSAMLRDPSVADDQNLVGVLDGVQTVGDDQQGLTLYQFGDSLLNIASSKMTMGASFRMQRAIEMRCFSPPERVAPPSPTTV